MFNCAARLSIKAFERPLFLICIKDFPYLFPELKIEAGLSSIFLYRPSGNVVTVSVLWFVVLFCFSSSSREY